MSDAVINNIGEGGQRSRYVERLKSKYPERDFSDDEALFEQVNADYDEHEGALSGYQERERAMSDLFTKDPRSAALLATWREGGDPAVELVRMFGEEILEARDDPEKMEAFAQASKEFAERVAKEGEFEQEYEANMTATLETLSAFEQEGKTEEEIESAMEFLMGIVRDGVLGKFTKESVQMAFNALGYDEAVAEAEHVGEVRGRNTKIQERLRKNTAGDGTATLAGKSQGGGTSRETPDLGAIDRNYGSSSIWERGNEQRKRYR